MAGILSPADAGGVVDARTGSISSAIGTSRDPFVKEIAPPDSHGHNTIYLDNSISFENYHWWANRSREAEKHITTNAGLKQIFSIMIGKKIREEESQPTHIIPEGEDMRGDVNTLPEKVPNEKVDHDISSKDAHRKSTTFRPKTDQWGVTESEWETAQRATRTATWGTIFYLITTDILGPYSVPWAIAQMGYGPGVALFTVFGVMAYYSAMQLWKMFIGLDSTRYPMRNYGDLGFRIYGNWARIGINVLQSFQFFLNVVLLIESNGQGIAQMAAGVNGKGYICFMLAEAIFMIAGFLFGQIRTLQRLGWLANIAVWLNVVVIIMTMVVTARYGPNHAANANFGITGPVTTSANWPKPYSLSKGISGLMNGVFAYGGATLFNELMAEMRRPYDFWKALLIADIFIYVVYMIMGLVVYSFQGQYSFNPAYQGIPNAAYTFQTVGNGISVVTGLIAALLYGNIGIKVFYAAVLRDVFRCPPLDNKKGKLIWVVFVPIYWGLAWIIAAAVPQISGMVAFVGAACILQFSYTFPPILLVGYNCQKDAMLPEEEYNPETGETKRVDHGWTRWMRGYKKKMLWNTFDVLYFLGALSCAGLGIYASIILMNEIYSTTAITAFTCANPAG